jgi:glycosyltransferase involved in cell wall biosynthesis
MPRIGIVTPHITFGDAVCNDVFGMYDVFKNLAVDTRIFAADWKLGQGEYDLKPISEIASFLKTANDVLIYHHSMGWRAGWEICSKLPCRKVIKYHNVTPPEFFEGWSDEYQIVCRAGREQTRAIATSGCDLYLSDSEYNMAELISEGAPESKNWTVPPFNQIDRLQQIEPDFEVIDKYRDGRPALLMVGSLFPNKGHLALLEIFATYFHDYNDSSRLFIVGKEGASLENYSDYLRSTAEEFGVSEHVVFAGQVIESALKSFYLMADIFVTASEHEGFCVPLVESMALAIPVLAIGSSAVPETVARTGLVWKDYNCRVFAESIDTLMKDEGLRSSVGQLGRRRYESSFTTEKIEQRLIDTLGALL